MENEMVIMNQQDKENRKNLRIQKNSQIDMNTIKKEILKYSEAFEKIKKITGANDVNEIIQKYLIEQETDDSLSMLKSKYLQKIEE